MISIKSKDEIKTLIKSGAICDFVLRQTLKKVKPGIATIELDKIAYRIIEARNAKPSFLDYEGYPNSICISINDELVHGIPGPRIIKKGDVVGIDVGVEYQGMFTDCAATIIVGSPEKKSQKLLEGVRKALDASIEAVKPDAKIGDIEFASGNVLKQYDLSPVLSLSGHGVGYAVHEEPSIMSDGKRGAGATLKEGMVLAIEPMAALGSGKVFQMPDGWTIKTKDQSLTAHFEKTVVVTQNGCKILT